MFILSKLKDIAVLPPYQFDKNFIDATKEFLNHKYANKVIIDLGLVIVVWDLLKYDDTYNLPNDPNGYTRVYFRLVVFSPFVDEIIIGKVKSSNADGIIISLGFYDDIKVPSHLMQENSFFDEKDQTWYWNYETSTEDGSPQSHKLFLDIGEEIRFRVIERLFFDLNTLPPHTDEKGDQDKVVNKTSSHQAPFTLIGSIAEQGLGLLSWWT